MIDGPNKLSLPSIAALTLSVLLMPIAGNAQDAVETASFTEAQASEGKLTYDINCASCHGVSLEGAAVVPNLSGDSFASKWSGAPLNEFATELRQMPPGNASGLDEQDYAALAAYILSFSGIAAAPNTAGNALSLQSAASLPDMTDGAIAVQVANIASGAANVLGRLTPVTNDMLNNPPAEDWLLWQRSYDNQGYSSLDQINRETVSDLALVRRQTFLDKVSSDLRGTLAHLGYQL